MIYQCTSEKSSYVFEGIAKPITKIKKDDILFEFGVRKGRAYIINLTQMEIGFIVASILYSEKYFKPITKIQ